MNKKTLEILNESFKKYHLGLIIFVTLYIIYTLLTFKEFPITADEEFRYTRGRELLFNYINSEYLQTNIFPNKEPDTYYFYVMLVNILNPNFYYEWFHLQNMLFGVLAYVASYFLVYYYSQNKNFALLGPICLFLLPGFSGLIPANPIDGPFAVLIIFNIFLMYYFRNEGFTFRKVVILGFSFFLLLGLRPVGYQMFFHFLIFGIFFSDRVLPFKQKVLENVKLVIVIFFISSFFSVISWPYLGINYFKNLPGILFVNAKYDKWDRLILFDGKFLSKEERPWYYLFTYLIYTIPLFILAPFFYFINLKSKLKQFLIYFLVFNFTVYLVIQPVIYNGIRHFLYLFPIVCILGVFGIWDLYQSKFNKKTKIFIFSILLLSASWTITEMVKMFPNQYAYFNEVSGGFRKNYYLYETEYWGGMYKKGSEYIRDNLAKNNYSDLKVYSCNVGNSIDYYSYKKFQTVIKLQEADLIVCDYSQDKENNYNGRIIKVLELNEIPYLYIRENEFKKK